MIKNIIFDFGDIFINLDKVAFYNAPLKLLGLKQLTPEIDQINTTYEKGLISSEEFIQFYLKNYPFINRQEIIDAWNIILKDFPLHRLEFIKDISTKYRCFLLSNTNELHIDWIKNDWGKNIYNEFKNCYEQFYLSHEINMRKPDAEIYEFVLNENKLNANETLFIDDTLANTKTAATLGIHTWNLIPGKNDITELFTIKKELF